MADVLESLKGHINPIFLTYAVKKKINLDLDFSKFSVIVSNSGNNVEIKPKKILGAHEIPEYADYISFGYDKDKKEFYFTTTSQVYCTHEAKSLENPYNSAEVFVRSSSMVFDEKGREQYSSWYSDEIQIHEPEIDLQKLDTLKLLNQTRPHFYRGIMTQTPEHATIPFKECQERLGEHTIHKYGRGPIHGEYSNIGVTFDVEGIEDYFPIRESYGRLSFQGMPICAEQDDLVTEIDLAFKKACARGTFNQDLFNEEIANYQKSANEEFGL